MEEKYSGFFLSFCCLLGDSGVWIVVVLFEWVVLFFSLSLWSCCLVGVVEEEEEYGLW